LVSYNIERPDATLRSDREESREEERLELLDLSLVSECTVDTDTDLRTEVWMREERADPALTRAGLKDLEDLRL
jgi:hypothetical protein